MEDTKTFLSVLSLAVDKGTLFLIRFHNLISMLSWWVMGSCSVSVPFILVFPKELTLMFSLGSCFFTFIFGKLCTSKCLDKTILCSWTRVYSVDHAEEFSWQFSTTADWSCCSLWQVLGLPWPSWKPLDTPSALHVLLLMPYSLSYDTHQGLFQ